MRAFTITINAEQALAAANALAHASMEGDA